MHLGRQGFVFDELKNLVFEHNGAFGERQIAPDLELAFIGHRNPAFFHVGQQVLHAAGNALALGVERFFLGIHIERKKVAGGCRCRPLLDGKAHAPAGLRIALQRIGQRQQKAAVEQMRCCGKARYRLLLPQVAGKAAVAGDIRKLVLVLPKRQHFLCVLLLQRFQPIRIQVHVAQAVVQRFSCGTHDGKQILVGRCAGGRSDGIILRRLSRKKRNRHGLPPLLGGLCPCGLQ